MTDPWFVGLPVGEYIIGLALVVLAGLMLRRAR